MVLWVNSPFPTSTPETQLALAAPPAVLWQESTQVFLMRVTSFCSPQLQPDHGQSQKRRLAIGLWKLLWSHCLKQSLCVFPCRPNPWADKHAAVWCNQGVNFYCTLAAPQNHWSPREIVSPVNPLRRAKQRTCFSDTVTSASGILSVFPWKKLGYFAFPTHHRQLLWRTQGICLPSQELLLVPHNSLTSSADELSEFATPQPLGTGLAVSAQTNCFSLRLTAKDYEFLSSMNRKGKLFRVKYITRVKKGEKKRRKKESKRCLPNIRKILRITQLTNVSFFRRNNDIIPIQKHLPTLETV